jgi:hypothetical protein
MSVQFHTQYVRGFWTNCAIGLIPDFLIGVAVAHFTDVGFIAVPVVMIGLPAIAFLLWLKQFPLRVILAYLGREKAIARTLDYLKDRHFPRPENTYIDAPGYFSEMVQNGELECQQRIDAAGIVMMFECMRAFQQVLALMAASMNTEEAIKRYERTFIGAAREEGLKAVR